jgi:hypothetical protein
MTLSVRFYSPVTRTFYAHGRSYSVTAGGTVDVIYQDGIAIMSDQAQRSMLTGRLPSRHRRPSTPFCRLSKKRVPGLWHLAHPAQPATR